MKVWATKLKNQIAVYFEDAMEGLKIKHGALKSEKNSML